MANYEATKYDFSGASLTGIEGVNTGIVIPWSSSSVPSGFLECDGSAVSRSTYANLFAVVGTTYGVGDGSTTFNVPDLADRTIVHKSPTKTFATTGGANDVTSTGNVGGSSGNTTLDTPTIASHSHTGAFAGSIVYVASGGEQTRPGKAQPYQPVSYTSSGTGGGGGHSHPLSANFTGSASSVLQPYLTVMYIIKT